MLSELLHSKAKRALIAFIHVCSISRTKKQDTSIRVPDSTISFERQSIIQCTPHHITHHIQSKLYIIVQQSYFLTRLERRETNVWTSITTESISQRAVSTRADLALDGEVHLSKIVSLQHSRAVGLRGRCLIELQLGQVGICCCAGSLVFCLESLCQAAGAVLASSPTLGVGLTGFGFQGISFMK